MIAKIRQTKQGTEYWDNAKKVILFVPAGSKPGFEVVEDPKSLLGKQEVPQDNDGGIDLDAMTIAQLRQFAAGNGIDLPGGRLTKDYILDFISKALSDKVADEGNPGNDNPDTDKDKDPEGNPNDGKPDAE